MSIAADSRVLLATAMRVELDPVAGRLGLKRDGRVFRGRVGGHEVIAAATGAGAAHVQSSLQKLFDDHAPARVLFCGFCAAASDDLHTGDVVPLSFVRGVGEQAYDVRSALPKPAEASACAPSQTLLTVDHIAPTPQAKQALANLAGALDMESLHAARMCHERQLALTLARVVCDEADHHVPAVTTTWIMPDGRTDIARASAYVMTHPAQWPTFMRLARASKRAGAALAGHVHDLLQRESS